jgi:hypothetical protein
MSFQERFKNFRILYSFPVLFALGFFLSTKSYCQMAAGETYNPRDSAVDFFMDCRSCDMNYIRREIPYVNFVRDTQEADVYLLVTRQRTGSGGNKYTFSFQGLDRFGGMKDTLFYTSNPDETRTIVREKKLNLIKMGLMRYVAHTPLSEQVAILSDSSLHENENNVTDKWNNWVFELETSPKFNAEASYNRLYISNSVHIRKITPELKLEARLNQSYNRQQYIEDSVTTDYNTSYKSARLLLVKSISPHWSTGIMSRAESSTSENYDLNTELMPSVEYDIYPYSEATRRQFRILYSIGYQYSDYIDTTILNKKRENLFKQELQMAYEIQEKWGSINLSLSGSNYLHDFSKDRIQIRGYIRLRIIKGLSLFVNGGFAYINDQLNLVKGDLTDAERLLRLKEQATNFSTWGGVGITYTFGSIYNNVVNPRFGD